MRVILRSIYIYELKKLFFAKVNMIALAGSAIMLVFLSVTSVSEALPVSREAAQELDGRAVDAQLIEEIKPVFKYKNGTTLVEITPEYEKYTPFVDLVTAVAGNDSDLSGFQGADFYALREEKLEQRMEEQGLTEAEKDFWHSQEAKVQKPFIYHYHQGPANLLRSFQALGFFILLLSAVGLSGVYAGETADNMNQLLLCSRFGKKELYMVKFAAGLTWILTAAVIVILAILIPFYAVFGMEGMSEILQLVKPWSMLPFTIGQMISVHVGIYLLAALFFASVTMLLSVATQNALAVTCGLLGYLLIDLFAEAPEKNELLQKIWSLRPNAVLMNTGYTNYKLYHLAGRLFLNYQAAPVVYAVIMIATLIIGRWKYDRLQVGN